ncbi:MAG TPA: hypothetical protein VK088_01035 [Acidimicrobiia bacterium]|nr:hypothetical protein [Acidimicrobiia bacterium]
MKYRVPIALASLLALALAACNGDEAQITTTTLDASQLTTTTTTASTGTDDGTGTTPDSGPTTTVPTGDPVESYEVIARVSEDDRETLYILVPPGEYTDVSMENFLGNLLEDETVVSDVEVFDDRAALDAAQKPADERTDEENELIEQHHLVSLQNARQVQFQGPMSEYDGFVIGS